MAATIYSPCDQQGTADLKFLSAIVTLTFNCLKIGAL